MLIMKPCPGIRVQKIYIPSGARRIPALVLSPEELSAPATGVLWIHGGGYISGMKEMVYISRAVELVKSFGAVVVSPRLPARAVFAVPRSYRRLLRCAALHEGARGGALGA